MPWYKCPKCDFDNGGTMIQSSGLSPKEIENYIFHFRICHKDQYKKFHEQFVTLLECKEFVAK